MATIRLTPSAYTRSSTNRVTVTNDANMYHNTDWSTNYATLRGRNNSNSTYYCFIHGFDFSQVPSNANVTAFSVKIKCYRSSNQRTGSNYDLRLASTPSSSSVISNTTASTTIGTSASVITIPTGSLTWTQLTNYGTNFSIDVVLASNSSSYPYVYVYGAEIEVTYTAETIHPTGVSVSPTVTTIEQGETVQLTETVLPANADDKSVTWSSSNTSIATVNSSGLVTGVSPGSATITVTTTDGSLTATCVVTVTQAVLYTYKLVTSMEVGKKYLIANGNTGSVYLLSNESGGSRQLVGISTTISNNRITINGATKSRVEYVCVRYTSGNDVTITVSSDNKYLYSDNSTGLRLNAPSTLDRFWHYRDNKFWQFKSTSSDGYSDTSSEYKYYLTLSGNNFTDNHVTSPSIEDSTNLPLIYIYTEDDGTGDDTKIYLKENNSWVQYSKVYKKINGSWVEQSATDIPNILSTTANYVKGN